MPEKKSTSADSTSVADNGPGGTDLGRASYRAEQARDAVIIFAFGFNPTPDYTNFFEQSPIDIFPPEFIFRSIPPGGFVPQLITPFAIWVMFGSSEPVANVTVHDADGPHKIKVEQMSEALAAALKRATWVSGHVVRGGGGIGGRASTIGIGEEEPGLNTQVRGEDEFARVGAGAGGRATTMATGEEGGEGPTTMATGEELTAPTTMATGEEGGGPTTMATGEETTAAATFGGGQITTLALGEETTATTLRLGEEHITTFAIGEEGPTTVRAATTLDIGEEVATTLRAPTTLAIGEEDPTTRAVGEEGPTTLAVGEEDPTTDAIGEEGPTTMAIGEETTQVVRSTPFGSF